jgi:ribosomal protein S18 acetylase RimI-like enzyme
VSGTATLRIEPIGDHDREAVVALWRACGLVVPHNPPLADIELAAGKPNSDILLGFTGNALVASVLVGHDGHRGWLYYLAVAPERQGEGCGAAMVRAAEAWLRDRGIRKAELMVRETNAGVIGFYERIGYDRAPVTVMQRWLVDDTLAEPSSSCGATQRLDSHRPGDASGRVHLPGVQVQ